MKATTDIVSHRLKDSRSKRVIFVSHCILNENTRYLGGAFASGVTPGVLTEMTARGVGIVQMKCPEQLAWGGVHKQYMWVGLKSPSWALSQIKRCSLRSHFGYSKRYAKFCLPKRFPIMKATGKWTVRGLFIRKPGTLRLFYLVQRYIKSLGSVNVTPSKMQVSFARKTKFAWVWLPQLWTHNRPESSITLTFALPFRVVDQRIVEAVQPRTGHWTHHVVLASPKDFDSVVKGWILHAYLLAGDSETERGAGYSMPTRKTTKPERKPGGRTSPNNK